MTTNTIPDSWPDNINPIGPSALKHPIYTFKMTIASGTSELVGPNTNQRAVTMLSPDQYQTSPNLGRTQNTARKNQFLSWIPGLRDGENLFHVDGDTFTVYGKAGTHIKTNYADIANPLVVVTNSPPYTSP